MELPSVPTDNLYKFMALSGLAIVITCLYLFFSRADQLNERFYSVAERMSILEANMDEMSDETSKIDVNIGELRKAADDRDVLPQLTSKIEEVENLKNELSRIRKEAVELAAAAEVNGMILSMQKRQAVALAFIGFLGILISSAGFGLWYLRVQKFLDVQLANMSSVTNGGGPVVAVSPPEKTTPN